MNPRGPCAKKRVYCTIVTPSGVRFHGDNACGRPMKHCPRLPGEGYLKCRLICAQPAHAEMSALWKAQDSIERLDGSVAYVTGIDRICDECRASLAYFNVTPVLGAAPAP